MKTYCVKCMKITESKNPKDLTTKNRRKMLLSKCSLQ